MATTPPAPSIASKRPGTPAALSSPSTMASGSTPRARAALAAAKRRGVELAAEMQVHGALAEAEAALGQAELQVRASSSEYETVGISARSTSRRPNSSSRLTTAKRARLRGEQPRFRREVRLERLVVVEVIPGQVREHGHVEPDPVDPMLHEGVRGHFDRAPDYPRRAGARAPAAGAATRVSCAPPRASRSPRWATRPARGSTGADTSPSSCRSCP